MNGGGLLFVHDHRFARGEEGAVFTSTGALPASAWSRYLACFETVRVVAREAGVSTEVGKLARSDRDGVTFRLVPNLSGLRARYSNSAAIRRVLAEELRRADAVVVRLPSELGLAAAAMARTLGKPLVVEVVGCAWDGFWHYGSPVASVYAPLAYVRMRYAVSRAPFALYVTRQWLQDRYPCSGRTVSVSNVEIASPADAVRQARRCRLVAISGGALPILGTIGSLATKYKGIQTAISALARLRAEGLTLEYRVLGAGDPAPWRALAARAGVGDLVRFDGVLPAGEPVRRWLDDVDIYLQPSFQEGLPRATIEAMSRGCACIGSTAGGLPELLPPNRLHRPGHVAGLGAAVAVLTRDPAALAVASEDGFARAREFAPEALHERRVAFYRALQASGERARTAFSANFADFEGRQA